MTWINTSSRHTWYFATIAYSILLITGCFLAGCIENQINSKEVVVSSENGLMKILTMEDYNRLSFFSSTAGSSNQQEVKFVITDVQTRTPALYFVNTTIHQYHYDFIKNVLGHRISLVDFNTTAYFCSERNYLVGEIAFYPHFVSQSGTNGIFTVGFWPSDPVSQKYVRIAYELVSKNLLINNCTISYHPKGNIQEKLIVEESYDTTSIPYILSDRLFGNLEFIPYNTGESYGTLRLSPQLHYSFSDIAHLQTIPNYISHLSGIITESPQTPLSHVNIIAKQNKIPNAYIRDILKDPAIVSLDNKYIHFKVTSNSYLLEEATEMDVLSYIEKFRPASVQTPSFDTSVQQIRSFDEIGFSDSKIYGAKAANLAELRKILPKKNTPDGFVIPFIYYFRFMNANGFFSKATTMMTDTQFQTDPDYRSQKLEQFRKKIKSSVVDSVSNQAFQALMEQFPSATTLRCRSSANTEDLDSFSGAGVHSSFTHHLDEGFLSKSILQVWASIWNFSAFQERSFYKVDHLKSGMSVLVHPNFEDEKANGVAVTKNIYDPNWRGFYVNVQVGEDLVTNPDSESIPEEFLVSDAAHLNEYETQYLKYSNRVKTGEKILTELQIKELVHYMELIQDHFWLKYNALKNPAFAMEIEFKITSDNLIVIKQARPWID